MWSLKPSLELPIQTLETPCIFTGGPKGWAAAMGHDPCCQSSPFILLSGDQARLLQEILLHHSPRVQWWWRGRQGKNQKTEIRLAAKITYECVRVCVKGHMWKFAHNKIWVAMQRGVCWADVKNNLRQIKAFTNSLMESSTSTHKVRLTEAAVRLKHLFI